MFNTICLSQNYILDLWPDNIPNYKKTNQVEKSDSTDIVKVSFVQKPNIAVYLPSKRIATGQAVIICPGGGYRFLAYDLEGTDVAKWFNSKGIAAIILKYRLPISKSNITNHKSPLLDAQRAIRLTRYHAYEWNINGDKIGIMGFSAGGHLASTAGTHFDDGDEKANDPIETMSSRPDFMILLYPVVTFTKPFMHPGSSNRLLGENPDSTLLEYYSNELHVTKDTPPTFIVHSGDDPAAPVENSLVFYSALKDKGVPAEMHLYQGGTHGYSLAIDQGYWKSWTDLCIDWLIFQNRELY